ncbi:MAG: BrnT family toxin [Acidobacteriota bacterium]|nr:BrnT family toxin [Acidobacteriota bacterium]
MNFEWDEEKNKENIRKHGFDFADAWEIFEAPMRTALDLRADYGEARWNGIGLLGNRIVIVVFTYRGKDTLRIISLRKAIKYERKEFEEAIGNRLGEN